MLMTAAQGGLSLQNLDRCSQAASASKNPSFFSLRALEESDAVSHKLCDSKAIYQENTKKLFPQPNII